MRLSSFNKFLRGVTDKRVKVRLRRRLQRKQDIKLGGEVEGRIQEKIRSTPTKVTRVHHTLIIHDVGGKPVQAVKYASTIRGGEVLSTNPREVFALERLTGTPLAIRFRHDARKKELVKEFVHGEVPHQLTQREISVTLPRLLALMHANKFKGARFGLVEDRIKPRKKGTFRTAIQDFVYEVSVRKFPTLLTLKEKRFLQNALKTIFEKAQQTAAFNRNDFSLIMNDYSKYNMVRQKNGQIKFIDYGDTEINDPAKDVANLFAKMGLNTKERQAFAKAYSKRTNDTTIHERARLWQVIEEIRQLKKREDISKGVISKKLDKISELLSELN